jgi:hypothetical protein
MNNKNLRFLGALGLIGAGMLTALVSLAGTPGGTSAAQGATVSLLPSSQNVDLGESLAVDVAIENATDIAAFEFRVKYDPDILELQDVSETDFLASTGRTITCPPITNEQARKTTDAWFGCATINTTNGPPVSGSGVLAHITFTAKGAGITYLTFVKLELADDFSDDCCSPISWNESSVRVVGSEEPTPENLPPTPTRDPAALTPTPIVGAPTPSTYLTPEPGQTSMTRTVDAVRASTGSGSDSSDSQGSAGGSPRAGEGPGKAGPAWWPPLLAGLLAAAGASLLPLAFYLRGASSRHRI